ncbi:MAG TPA: peptidoglycan DD-metalloendopeptidase family protein [Trinickia sp.]|jgi:murein DD-endopeptidase MepM/ murein hydrolase activator NlpD|uniref:peptidoglycan DD-metalloendopeptidase family protein n=1 Tax=Trinickia sp. TaxID=2571163 RepID=UPI002C0FC3B3|nr:peptidoglycan DD-metalloendopeptidase family protein [Trinickia sp.]HVW52606.1 peptidoglycan DD-metalloendopeptidase family protein [Trinickia sp.]
MALPALVVPTTRIGKAVLFCAISSACVAVMLSPVGRNSHSDDETLPAAGPSPAARDAHDADTLRAAQPDAASSANTLYNDAPSGRSPAAGTPASPSGPIARSVTIDSSFAEAMRRLGVDASVTGLLAHAFAGQIDFRRDLRKGDIVSLVMPPAHAIDAASSAQATDEMPLAVRISHGDTDHDLFLHRDLRGKPFYYTANGRSGAPGFARYPLAFTRVSSKFAARRLDPVTHRWQSHDGVDFAAPVGTPVHATARGTISYIGWETGYGKIVVIDNAPPYQTAFAHLSRFARGLHRGAHVRRGQVIGYVGKTGWATGPHLHYEVRVADVPRNPLTVALPGDTPLHGNERKQFAQRANRLAALF